ncbi:hypothetical protein ACPXCP_39170 [Streptomyces sp. DT20]|uniref:hypothetical protein n=1 Tax=Streptomyces sp. DT20 TaxID=3416519 RepID=UPI003CF37F10
MGWTDLVVLAGDPPPLLPGAKPKAIPGLAPVVQELFGYGLYLLVLAGATGVGVGVFKMATANKGRGEGGSEPFKWMGAGLGAVMIASVLISVINGVAG